MADMEAMKAIRCDRFGPPEVLKLEKTNIPEPSGDEVLLRNYSTSVNTADVLMRSGKPPSALSTTAKILLGPLIRLGMSGIRKPRQKRPGFGLCGEIVGIGDNVKDWEIGEKVYGYHKNTYAEYVTVPAKKLARKPDNLNFVEAGAVPGGASPAVGWFQVAKPEEGQNVLIIGASGGIGTFGVQIAKNCYNAIVTGVCGPTNLEMVKSIGADHVIDYTKEDYTSSDEKYDIIYDAIGVNTYSNCKKARALGGVGDFLIGFILQLLILFLFAAVLSFVLKGFGGTASTSQSLRMIGFASIWSVIQSLVDFIPIEANIGLLFTILFLAALTLGLSAFSGKGVVVSFIALIIAYIIAAILTFIIIVFVVLGLLLAVFAV